MNETLREWVVRIAAESERRCDWLEFEADDGSARLVAGELACRDDRVEFEDDSGLVAELAYGAIRAVRTGRQGEATMSVRRTAPPLMGDLAA